MLPRSTEGSTDGNLRRDINQNSLISLRSYSQLLHVCSYFSKQCSDRALQLQKQAILNSPVYHQSQKCWYRGHCAAVDIQSHNEIFY